MSELGSIEFQREAQAALLSKKKRHLDDKPTQIKFKHIKIHEQVGIASDFTLLFNTLLGELPDNECKVCIRDNISVCDKLSFVALKALILFGVSKDSEVSKACSDVFKAILSKCVTQDEKGLCIKDSSVKSFIEKYSSINYTTQQIVVGMRNSMFPDDVILLHWHQVSYCGEGNYINAIKAGDDFIKSHQNIETVEELDAILLKACSEAKKDKEFYKLIDTTLASDYLIGMMRLTFEKNNSIFIVNDSKDKEGFM